MRKLSLPLGSANLEADSKVSTVSLPGGGSKPLFAYRSKIWRRAPSNSLPEENLDDVSNVTSEAKEHCQLTRSLYLDHVERCNNKA